MSRSIDQKVVEMKFDNKQFEDAVKQSRQSIKLMEKDITLLEGAKSLKNLDKAIQSVDFTHMTKSIDRYINYIKIYLSLAQNKARGVPVPSLSFSLFLWIRFRRYTLWPNRRIDRKPVHQSREFLAGETTGFRSISGPLEAAVRKAYI